MDTLAFLHAAAAYEDPTPNVRFKDTDFRSASSVAIGFLASGIVASTVSYADAAQATLYYGSTGSDVAKLQKALGNITVDGVFGSETLTRLKSYQAKKGLIVDGIAGRETLSSLGWSSLSKNSKGQDIEIGKRWGEPEQYGRLQLINDTPYMAIVLLYESGNKYSSKYAHIPPCSKRTLLNTYSSSWEISLNQNQKFSIGKPDNNLFKVKLSQLNKENIQLCEYDNLVALRLNAVAVNVSLGKVDEILMVANKADIDQKFKLYFNGLVDSFLKGFNILYRKAIDAAQQLVKWFLPKDEAWSKGKSLLSPEDMGSLFGRGEDVDRVGNAIIGRYVKADGAPNENDIFYMDVADELKNKYLAGELDLDNPNDPDKGILTVLRKIQKECPDIKLDLNLTKELIEKMKPYFETANNIKAKLNDSLPKDNSNPSLRSKSAKNMRSEICKVLGINYLIFLNYSNQQSQKIPKKCI